MSTEFNPYTGKYEYVNSHGWSDSGHYLSEFDQRNEAPQGGSSGGGGGGSSGGGDGAAVPVLSFLAVLALVFLGLGYVSMSDIKTGAEVNTWSLYALVRALPVLLVIWASTASVLRACFRPPTVTWYMVLMVGMSLVAGPESAVFLGGLLVLPLAVLKGASSDLKGMLLGVLVGCWLLFGAGCAVSIFKELPILPNSDLMRAMLSQVVMPTDSSHLLSDFEALVQPKFKVMHPHRSFELMTGFILTFGGAFLLIVRNGCFPDKVSRIYLGVWVGFPWLVLLGFLFLSWGNVYIIGLSAVTSAICGVIRLLALIIATAALLAPPLAGKEAKLSNWFQSVYADNKLVVLGLIGMIGTEVANVFGLLSFL